MIVRSILRKPLVMRNTKSLEYLVRCCHALIVTTISQPQEADIFSGIQTSRCDQASQSMVVERE